MGHDSSPEYHYYHRHRPSKLVTNNQINNVNGLSTAILTTVFGALITQVDYESVYHRNGTVNVLTTLTTTTPTSAKISSSTVYIYEQYLPAHRNSVLFAVIDEKTNNNNLGSGLLTYDETRAEKIATTTSYSHEQYLHSAQINNNNVPDGNHDISGHSLGLFDMSTDENCVDVNEIMYKFGDWTLRLDVQLIYSSIYALIFVIGLIGNGLLIGTIRKRMTVANVFLINLATSDLLLCITALPITPVLAFVKRWIFGSMMCKLVPLCQGISVLISSYCLCLIAVDRYRSIVTPMKVPWSVVEAQIFMALCWMGSVAISSPLFFTQRLQQIVYENTTLCGEFCGEYDWPQDARIKLAYGSALLVVQYLIPVSIMTFCYWKILQKVRQDWIVNTGSMLTEAQQTQTSMRKRRVMYVLILMVAVFMGSWMPLTVVNILRDIGVGFLDIQMYFKLLNVHALAMTSIVSNPLLALKDDMFWFTNVRRQQQNIGLFEKFAPSPSMGILYRKSLERHLLGSAKYNPYRRGTLADPTCMSREKALQEMHANCFLLVPLMPLCVPSGPPSPRPIIGPSTSQSLSRTTSTTTVICNNSISQRKRKLSTATMCQNETSKTLRFQF